MMYHGLWARVLPAAMLATLPAVAGITYDIQKQWTGHTCDATLNGAGQLDCTGPLTQQSGNSSFDNPDAYAMVSASADYFPSFMYPNALSVMVSAYAGSGIFRVPQSATPGQQFPALFQVDSVSGGARVHLDDELQIFAPVSSGFLSFELFADPRWEAGSFAQVIFSNTLIPFTSGQSVSWSALVEAGAGDIYPNNPSIGASQSSARLDISSVSLLDAQGSPVSGWSYRSASGWKYNAVDGEEIPEPAAMLLTAAGLLGLFCRRLLPVCRL